MNRHQATMLKLMRQVGYKQDTSFVPNDKDTSIRIVKEEEPNSSLYISEAGVVFKRKGE